MPPCSYLYVWQYSTVWPGRWLENKKKKISRFFSAGGTTITLDKYTSHLCSSVRPLDFAAVSESKKKNSAIYKGKGKWHARTQANKVYPRGDNVLFRFALLSYQSTSFRLSHRGGGQTHYKSQNVRNHVLKMLLSFWCLPRNGLYFPELEIPEQV